MSVILLILKIIGIVLLALLGLIVALLLLVLFVPVRYMVSGKVEEDAAIAIRVTWLLHLVTWKAVYADGAFDSCLRILGIRKGSKKTGDAEDEPDIDADAEDDAASDVDADVEAGSEPETDADVKDDAEPDTGQEAIPEITVRGGGALSAEMAQIEQSQAGLTQAADENVNFQDAGQRKPGIFQRIKSFFTEIKSRYLKFKMAVSEMKEKVSDIKSMIVDENNKIVLCGVLGELKYLLSHFKFRKIDTDLRFSLGDPAATGQALGVLCMIPYLYQYQFQVYPDFEAERAYVQGTFEVKGRVRAVHGAVSLLRLIKKKEVRALLKKLLDNK